MPGVTGNGSKSGPLNKETPMTVTVVYPEDRQIPDLARFKAARRYRRRASLASWES